MSLIEIDSVGRLGMVKDEKDYRLDPTAWTTLLNVRPVDDELVTIGGRSQVFGSKGQAPYFLMPVVTPTQTFWLWASLTDVFVWNDIVDTELTRTVGGDYTATSADDWNGVMFGGIPVLNNGSDVPQFWATPSTGTKLANLTNWPGTYRAKVIRSLSGHLVAINLTVSGVAKPHMVKWSHPADPGTIPSSWDHTDATKDAGEVELADVESGMLLDALNLRGQLYLYKGGSIWRMRYIGGRSKFAFDAFSETSGLLSTRCVGLTGDGQRHFVVSQDDIVIHNGNTIESVLDKRARRYLFNRIDASNYNTSFVFANFDYKEMVFCYPTTGEVNPNMALIWNWSTGTLCEMEVDFVAAASGAVVSTSDETWDGDLTGTWDNDITSWESVSRRRVLAAKPSNSKILQLESGSTFDGVVPTRLAQRTGLAISGQKRDRTPIVNYNSRKMVNRIYPRGTGGPFNVRLGAQDKVDGSIRWSETKVFTPENDSWSDIIIEGAATSIEISTTEDVTWSLEGYKLNLEVVSEY